MRLAEGPFAENDPVSPIVVDSAEPGEIDISGDATLELLFRRLAREQILIGPEDRSRHAMLRSDRTLPAMLTAPRANLPADVDRLRQELAAVWHSRRNAPSR